MGFEQYKDCIFNYNGKVVSVAYTRSSYDGEWIYLNYPDSDTVFPVNAFETDLIQALPSPDYGLLKKSENEIIFSYKGIDYLLSDYPYDPCIYIKKDGKIIRTLYNAFTVYDLPEYFAEGNSLESYSDLKIDLTIFCRIIAAVIENDRTEMNFSDAVKLIY